jgi:ribose-phosphate pyrophosphokinase
LQLATVFADKTAMRGEEMNTDPMLVFGGSGSPGLTARICDYLQIEPGKNETLRFSDGNTFVRILENVRAAGLPGPIYGFPTNDNFMELLFGSTPSSEPAPPR